MHFLYRSYKKVVTFLVHLRKAFNFSLCTLQEVNILILYFFVFIILFFQLDSITADDIKLSVPDPLEQNNGSFTEAPATHVSIFECPFFSLGVFILRKGCSIPLHDHPDMFGLW